MSTSTRPAVTPAQMLEHWQGHRRLTRRVIDAFPADQLFHFTLGGMRSFGTMALEIIEISAPTVVGVATGEWERTRDRSDKSKAEVLRLWDEATAEIDEIWPRIPAERFQEEMTAFGQFKGRGSELVWYAIDNEIHHRGQGYVYLRAMDVAPPPFYNRS